MDIKAEITKIVDKLKNDKTLLAQFQTDPLKAVKSLLDVNIPDEVLEQVVTGVKAKLAGDKLGGVASAFKKLF